MNLFESRYFNLNRLLMSSIGLWPYQKEESRRIKMIFVSFVLLLGIMVQLMSFITIEYSRDLLTKVFSFSFIVLICTIKYNVLYFKSEQYLFERVLYDWHALTDAEEIKIIQQYANKGRTYTILAGLIVYVGILIFITLFFVPDVLDIVAPLNEPRRHQLPIVIETFFDQEKYFLFISLNFLVISSIDLTILLTVELLYVICIQHACGLLKVTSYRILHAFDNHSTIRLQERSIVKSKCAICIKLVKAIKIHKRSLEFVECLCSTFSISYLILCVFWIASLSINVFELLKAIESKHTNHAIYLALFITAHLGYIFWVNYFGQNLIDNSIDVFVQTYNVQWYMVSPHIQKKILFILHRSSKNVVFDVGNSLFTFSLDGVAALINSSLSYTMLLYSTRT
ncbi:PREDICTED: uncharacterized protein LOC105559957 isoform X2 [Vollenhovia emeryi]|uniref:uncharacterized protein LOC105559957 isoform X2 n=1 Tax=Vollenhovia emeryi TaxID=411798 RepID=UPI0005F42AA6|nr:PREDICTED: uncharacterized protein LOC105559957 isoform X2 [Vollenhovia emeryi]